MRSLATFKSTFTRALFIAAVMVAQSTSQAALADNYGLADKTGKIIVEPVYASITKQSDGCFLVKPHFQDRKKVPFILNQKGVRVEKFDTNSKHAATANAVNAEQENTNPSLPKKPDLPAGTTLIGERSDGIFDIRDAQQKRGFCDRDGKILLPLADCSDLRLILPDRFMRETYDLDGKRTRELLAMGGKVVSILPDGVQISSEKFCDGLVRVSSPGLQQMGYLDHDGKIAISLGQFIDGEDFNEGYASVRVLKHGIACGALIDPQGKIFAGPYPKGSANNFYNGLAFVSVDEKHTGLIDRSGKFVVDPKFSALRFHNEHLAGVRDNQWQLLSTAGEVLKVFPSKITYLDCRSRDGLWIFGTGGKASDDIDEDRTDGKPPRRKKLGLMDSSGKIILPAKYDEIRCDENGYAEVKELSGDSKEMLTGLVNSAGKVLLPCQYTRVTASGDYFLLYTKQPGGFEPERWEDFGHGKTFFDRKELWMKFLIDFDLIGMPRQQVDSLLGSRREDKPGKTPDKKPIYAYQLNSGFMCGNASRGIEIKFDNEDKVEAWREAHGGTLVGADANWIRENKIYEWTGKDIFSRDRLISKYKKS